jgi:hypothetical protein
MALLPPGPHVEAHPVKAAVPLPSNQVPFLASDNLSFTTLDGHTEHLMAVWWQVVHSATFTPVSSITHPRLTLFLPFSSTPVEEALHKRA